ncbi:MAG: MBL fold metallo-hydrolase [Bacteroidales bacterium]|nr:MBL fold metallo-hydrolase [Bacteroidales bacterium]
MKITNLTVDSTLYTSNVFLVQGTWNSIEDINTLVDVGSDIRIIKKIESINTGLGKNKVDQVILTHCHSDHSAILEDIRTAFRPRIYAFNSHLKRIDHILRDGDTLKIGEHQFEVIHLTFHSYDSVCLYCEAEAILFAGDTTFPVIGGNEALMRENEKALGRLLGKDIKTVYPGHGPVQHFNEKKFMLMKESKIESG